MSVKLSMFDALDAASKTENSVAEALGEMDACERDSTPLHVHHAVEHAHKMAAELKGSLERVLSVIGDR